MSKFSGAFADRIAKWQQPLKLLSLKSACLLIGFWSAQTWPDPYFQLLNPHPTLPPHPGTSSLTWTETILSSLDKLDLQLRSTSGWRSWTRLKSMSKSWPTSKSKSSSSSKTECLWRSRLWSRSRPQPRSRSMQWSKSKLRSGSGSLLETKSRWPKFEFSEVQLD